MTSFWQFLFYAVIGFVVAYAIMFYSDLASANEFAIIALYVVVGVMWIFSLIRYRQIKRLNEMDWMGEKEDQADEIKYKKFADYSLFTNTSIALGLLALSISIISLNVIFIIIGMIVIIVTTLLSVYMMHLMKHVYPDRNIPNASDPDFSEKMLHISDDGEKHVILEGLYKSYQLFNGAVIFAIVLATTYSIFRESQLISIILMVLVMLIVNGRYVLVIRNKT